MAALTEARRIEMKRLLEQRHGEVLYDMSRLKIEMRRCDRELIEIEGAMQDLENDLKGTID